MSSSDDDTFDKLCSGDNIGNGNQLAETSFSKFHLPHHGGGTDANSSNLGPSIVTNGNVTGSVLSLLPPVYEQRRPRQSANQFYGDPSFNSGYKNLSPRQHLDSSILDHFDNPNVWDDPTLPHRHVSSNRDFVHSSSRGASFNLENAMFPTGRRLKSTLCSPVHHSTLRNQTANNPQPFQAGQMLATPPGPTTKFRTCELPNTLPPSPKSQPVGGLPRISESKTLKKRWHENNKNNPAFASVNNRETMSSLDRGCATQKLRGSETRLRSPNETAKDLSNRTTRLRGQAEPERRVSHSPSNSQFSNSVSPVKLFRTPSGRFSPKDFTTPSPVRNESGCGAERLQSSDSFHRAPLQLLPNSSSRQQSCNSDFGRIPVQLPQSQFRTSTLPVTGTDALMSTPPPASFARKTSNRPAFLLESLPETVKSKPRKFNRTAEFNDNVVVSHSRSSVDTTELSGDAPMIVDVASLIQRQPHHNNNLSGRLRSESSPFRPRHQTANDGSEYRSVSKPISTQRNVTLTRRVILEREQNGNPQDSLLRNSFYKGSTSPSSKKNQVVNPSSYHQSPRPAVVDSRVPQLISLPGNSPSSQRRRSPNTQSDVSPDGLYDHDCCDTDLDQLADLPGKKPGKKMSVPAKVETPPIRQISLPAIDEFHVSSLCLSFASMSISPFIVNYLQYTKEADKPAKPKKTKKKRASSKTPVVSKEGDP